MFGGSMIGFDIFSFKEKHAGHPLEVVTEIASVMDGDNYLGGEIEVGVVRCILDGEISNGFSLDRMVGLCLQSLPQREDQKIGGGPVAL